MRTAILCAAAAVALSSTASAQEVLEFEFAYQLSPAQIPGSRGATFCALSRVDDDTPDGSCEVGFQPHNGIWYYRTGSDAGANSCKAMCIFLPPSVISSQNERRRVYELEQQVEALREELREVRQFVFGRYRRGGR